MFRIVETGLAVCSRQQLTTGCPACRVGLGPAVGVAAQCRPLRGTGFARWPAADACPRSRFRRPAPTPTPDSIANRSSTD